MRIEFEYKTNHEDRKYPCGGFGVKSERMFRFRVGADWSEWFKYWQTGRLSIGNTQYVGFGSGPQARCVYRLAFEGRGPSFEI